MLWRTRCGKGLIRVWYVMEAKRCVFAGHHADTQCCLVQNCPVLHAAAARYEGGNLPFWCFV